MWLQVVHQRRIGVKSPYPAQLRRDVISTSDIDFHFDGSSLMTSGRKVMELHWILEMMLEDGKHADGKVRGRNHEELDYCSR